MINKGATIIHTKTLFCLFEVRPQNEVSLIDVPSWSGAEQRPVTSPAYDVAVPSVADPDPHGSAWRDPGSGSAWRDADLDPGGTKASELYKFIR